MIKKTKFKDLILINNKSFKDSRGYFKELLLEKNLKKKFPFLVMSFLLIHLFNKAISSRQAILNPCLFSTAWTNADVL